MDRTASFLLDQVPARLAVTPGGVVTLARTTGSGSIGRLAAPLPGLPPPGAPVLSTYILTTMLFDGMMAGGQGGTCPCSKTLTLDPTTDVVTVAGNKGTITSTVTVSLTGVGSKVSIDLRLEQSGEVRDSVTGEVIYKVANRATGHAEGDACPDASGVARGSMTFGYREDYFDRSGAKTGRNVSESFGGEIRVKADDNARLAGVELSTTGKGADFLMRMAAQDAAPAFEKGWRKGSCIAVLVSPEGGAVEKESVTTVTAKVKHKNDGNELDKPVEAGIAGVKSIDPHNSKQKAPATFRYTAGSADGDSGALSFESVSNRGIGRTEVTFVVGGGWTINSTGTSVETYAAGITNNLKVLIKDLKVTVGKAGALTGSGTMTLSGTSSAVLGPAKCSGTIDEETVPITAFGTFEGVGANAKLRLTLETPTNPNSLVALTCSLPGGGTFKGPATPQAHIGFYRQTLGEFDLPADGGTKTITGHVTISGVSNVETKTTFTVVKAKA
jgi:hypothetical protein